LEHKLKNIIEKICKMNSINVLLVPKEINHTELSGKIIVVIDILRASSTIVTALARGCRGLIPIFSPDKVKEKSKGFAKEEVLLGGERKGKKIKGFDLGNSPREYTEELVKDKIIIFSTTNGVKTLEMAKNAFKIVIGSFLNLQAVCDYCYNFQEDIIIVCAGKDGNFSLEDSVCAGMLINSLKKNLPGVFRGTDANIAVQILYKKYGNNILGVLKKSQHGKYLESIGLGRDLEFCSTLDAFNIVPIFENRVITTAEYRMRG